MKLTLEQLLRTKIKGQDSSMRPIEVTPEFRLSVQRISTNGVHFTVQAEGVNGAALDLVINDNNIKYLGD